MKPPIALAALLTVGLVLVGACLKHTAKAALDGSSAQNPEEVQGWSYSCNVAGKGSKSEGRWGYLYYRQKMLIAPAGTVVTTPVGRFLFFGGYDLKGWGTHGWQKEQTYGRSVFDSNGSVVMDLADQFLRGHVPVHAIAVVELLRLNGIEPDTAQVPPPSSVTPAARPDTPQP